MSTTKADLVSHVAKGAGIKKAEAEKVLESLTGAIQKALSGGDKVTVVGFGTFDVSTRAARKGRNPQTKAPMDIPAAKSVRFKVGKALKDSI